MDQTFFVQALIYLGSAVIMVPLAKRFGLGSVLGYLIAGVLIGPFVLGWVGNEGGDIMDFAEMGVVMMLFLIGLDVEPKMLWRWRRAIVGMGGLQVFITAAVVGFIVHTFFNMSISQGIALGLIFAMSSTAIVLQTMTENNWMQTSAGRSSFSVLLFQDIAVILILAILPLLSPDHGSETATATSKPEFLMLFQPWARTLVVLGAVGIIVVGGRYLTRPLFQMVAATNLRELFSATALFLVFGVTALMSLVGLSPALGAFLGGVVLANSEYRHELEGEIEPFKGLLLGLFFIAVGISINFSLIEHHPLLIILCVLGVMITKLLILTFLGWAFRMSRKQYLLFAFALAQVGEFAFVLLTFSEKQGIFSKDLFGLLMVIVAVSMVLSPVFMLFLDKVWMQHVFKRFYKKEDSEEDMPEIEDIPENNNVIIAGYGRFGSVIGRFLRVNGIEATILDADSERIETLRKMGIRAYYGDALRLDLLKSAGAANASLIVVALNGKAKKMRLVKTIKKHFPQIHIIARAHDQRDAYELMDAGVLHVYRETLDTSIRAGKEALALLGMNEKAAQRAAEIFYKHDERTLKSLAAARFDDEVYYKLVRAGTDTLHVLIQNDLELQSLEHSEDNHTEEEHNSEADTATVTNENSQSHE